MTKQTDSKILRQLVGGILTSYGIDNLELEFKLCDAYKKLYDSPEPRKTKDEILAGLQRGFAKHEQLQAISDEIFKRTGLKPVTQPWVEFVAYAWKMSNDKDQSITKFLDWWLADEWQRTHPPVKPDAWIVKWELAFIAAPLPSKPVQRQRVPSGV